MLFVLSSFHHYNTISEQNECYIRNQRKKLYRFKYFLPKKFFFEKSTWGGPRQKFFKKRAEGDHRSIFRKKFFLVKSIWIDTVFCADSEYNIYFAQKLCYNDENYLVRTAFEGLCVVFLWFCTNMVWTKNPYQSFCFLNNISKDAEFHGLSESVFSFLG
jgi:hypothetical protein